MKRHKTWRQFLWQGGSSSIPKWLRLWSFSPLDGCSFCILPPDGGGGKVVSHLMVYFAFPRLPMSWTIFSNVYNDHFYIIFCECPLGSVRALDICSQCTPIPHCSGCFCSSCPNPLPFPVLTVHMSHFSPISHIVRFTAFDSQFHFIAWATEVGLVHSPRLKKEQPEETGLHSLTPFMLLGRETVSSSSFGLVIRGK